MVKKLKCPNCKNEFFIGVDLNKHHEMEVDIKITCKCPSCKTVELEEIKHYN